MSERIAFGGAVITSALCLGVRPDRDGLVDATGRLGLCRRRPAGAWATTAPVCSLSLAASFSASRVAQVAHLRIAARLERRVEVRDERAEAQALRLLAAHEHAVRALVGDDARAAGSVGALRAGRAC